MPVKTRYITTDLDVFSRYDLSELAAYLQDHTCILHCGWREENLFHLCLEPQTKDSSTVEIDLDILLGAIEQLPHNLKARWDTAIEVDFNLAIETGYCHGHSTKVRAELLKRIAKLNATLSVTTYPAE